jgi:hypothetical protein
MPDLLNKVRVSPISNKGTAINMMHLQIDDKISQTFAAKAVCGGSCNERSRRQCVGSNAFIVEITV